ALSHRKGPAARAQAGHVQRDLRDRPHPAPWPRTRAGAAGDRPQAGGGLTYAWPAGTVAAPSPRARCIITVSSQRPNLRPTYGCVPIIRNPQAACTPTDPALAESPITAIICR